MNAPSASTCDRYARELAACAREALDCAEFRRRALTTVGELVGFDQGVFVEPSAEDPLTTCNVDAAALRTIQYCERHFDRYRSEVAPIMAEARRSRGVIDREFFSSSERSRSSFYADIVRPQGLSSMLVLLPQWRGSVLGMVRIERGGASVHRTRDLALALRLLPVVELGLVAFRGARPRGNAGLPWLSPRETEIAEHVARGLTTPQIALLLGTSRLTVRNQIVRIFDKTGVASRAELAGWVTRQVPY
jgi:DNA-binding CsgD family transcriptional regulator